MWKLFGKCISLLPSEQGDDNPRWFIRWSCAGGSLSQCVIGQTHIFQMDTLGKLSQFDVENQPFDQPFVDYFPGETIGFPDFFVCLPHQEKTMEEKSFRSWRRPRFWFNVTKQRPCPSSTIPSSRMASRSCKYCCATPCLEQVVQHWQPSKFWRKRVSKRRTFCLSTLLDGRFNQLLIFFCQTSPRFLLK